MPRNLWKLFRIWKPSTMKESCGQDMSCGHKCKGICGDLNKALIEPNLDDNNRAFQSPYNSCSNNTWLLQGNIDKEHLTDHLTERNSNQKEFRNSKKNEMEKVNTKPRRNHANRKNKQVGSEPHAETIKGKSLEDLMIMELFNSEKEFEEWYLESLNEDKEKELRRTPIVKTKTKPILIEKNGKVLFESNRCSLKVRNATVKNGNQSNISRIRSKTLNDPVFINLERERRLAKVNVLSPLEHITKISASSRKGRRWIPEQVIQSRFEISQVKRLNKFYSELNRKKLAIKWCDEGISTNWV
ncbi:MAG: hypothetical protein Ta2E_10350 [Mycoplasmoidaceae bacterium]|nr:MAG: hypothetical protein Ta2E_10350 [Mycoplasmoidaceae bacterium]